MKAFLSKLRQFFSDLFGGKFADKLLKGVERAVPYIRKAYEVCGVIAALTPNRTLKELLDAANHLGVPLLTYGTPEEGMRMIAFQALKKAFPSAPDSAINLAIEMAVGALKGEKEGVQGQ
jgi:hypothetical protein